MRSQTIRRSFAAIVLSVYTIVGGAGCAAKLNDRTLVVAFDKDEFRSREMCLFKDEVERAAHWSSGWINIAGTNAGDRITVTIDDLTHHLEFADMIEARFASRSGFSVSRMTILFSQIVQISVPLTGDKGLLAQKPFFDAMEEIEEMANPPIEVTAAGDAVSVRAKDPAHNAGLSAIVRQGFLGRTDLAIATRPDQSLLISLAPGAHIGPAVPSLGPGQLINAVEARMKGLKLDPASVSALDAERVRIEFASPADANSFEYAISEPSGFTMRSVDRAAQNAAITTPPSPGDAKLRLPSGEMIWVMPEALVTGDMVADAAAGEDACTKEPVVEFRLTDEGRDFFAAATRENVGRAIAIILDGEALSAPVVREPILGGPGADLWQLHGCFGRGLGPVDALTQKRSPSENRGGATESVTCA